LPSKRCARLAALGPRDLAVPIPHEWFFVTAQEPAGHVLWTMATDPDAMQDLLPCLQAYVFYQCIQEVRQVHGIVKMSVGCCVSFMFSVFRRTPVVMVEALRIKSVAALGYRQNQASSPAAVFPNGSFIRICEQEQTTFERKLGI
jgi:hypothetical protein